jgi:hypothetical protein
MNALRAPLTALFATREGRFYFLPIADAGASAIATTWMGARGWALGRLSGRLGESFAISIQSELT